MKENTYGANATNINAQYKLLKSCMKLVHDFCFRFNHLWSKTVQKFLGKDPWLPSSQEGDTSKSLTCVCSHN